LFVGNVNEQTLYHFDLNENRTKLDLGGQIADGIVENPMDIRNNTLGEKFGRITDLVVGPDGCLYVLSHRWNREIGQVEGSIYRIFPLTPS
jgi:aldose sugar dehydrogenase